MGAALQALIFDVDGTLADTEEAHRQAFNEAFAACGLDWHWDRDRYTELLQVSGGKERIRHHWQQVQPDLTAIDGRAIDHTIDQVHELKNAAYERRVAQGSVPLREGVLALIEAAGEARLQLAIATTTSPVNVSALLRRALGPDWALRFTVIEDASTAPRKKPHPQVYQQTLQHLGLHPRQAIAFEDSANGLKAAHQAGLATVVTPTAYTAHQDFSDALRVLPDLGDVTVPTLQQWHAAAH